MGFNLKQKIVLIETVKKVETTKINYRKHETKKPETKTPNNAMKLSSYR